MTTDTPTQIEETLAHHEKALQDLSDMVVKQWDEIDALKGKVKILQDKIGVLSQEAAEGQAGAGLSVTEQALRDKPPHY